MSCYVMLYYVMVGCCAVPCPKNFSAQSDPVSFCASDNKRLVTCNSQHPQRERERDGEGERGMKREKDGEREMERGRERWRERDGEGEKDGERERDGEQRVKGRMKGGGRGSRPLMHL